MTDPLDVSGHGKVDLELRRPLVQFSPENVFVGAFYDEFLELPDAVDPQLGLEVGILDGLGPGGQAGDGQEPELLGGRS